MNEARTYPTQLGSSGSISAAKAVRQNDGLDDMAQHADEILSRIATVNRHLGNLFDRLGFSYPDSPLEVSDRPTSLRGKLIEISSEISSVESKLNSL
jgi:hypothetical protein